jgi:hypothetical protein
MLDSSSYSPAPCLTEYYRYSPLAPELIDGRERARRLIAEFNAPPKPDIAFSEAISHRGEVVKQLFGCVGDGAYIEPPMFVDYGCNISVGEGFYANFKLVSALCTFPSILIR